MFYPGFGKQRANELIQISTASKLRNAAGLNEGSLSAAEPPHDTSD